MDNNRYSAEDLRPHVHAALRAWHEQKITPKNSLANLWLVRLKRQDVGDDSAPMLRRATNEVLQASLEQLRLTQPLEVELLENHFVNGDTHAMLARDHKSKLSKDMIKSRQAKTIEALTAVLLMREQQARDARIEQLLEGVPPKTTSQLQGVSVQLQQVCDALLPPAANHLIFITGIGGIGKTSLTNEIVRLVLPELHYEEMIWLRITEQNLTDGVLTTDGLLSALAKQLFPEATGNLVTPQRKRQIRHALKKRPFLIVVDNLETEVSSDLVNYLQDLAEPSSFMITSRMFPPDIVGVFHLPLGELSSGAALEVIRQDAVAIQLETLAGLSKAEIQPIYEVVGGNPLAIRLVTSLAKIRPLDPILADLRQAQTKRVEELYINIYWQAWRAMSAEARRLLEAMFAADEIGILPDQMQALSELDEAALWDAIEELVRHCLLEARGTLRIRRYGIHRLTASFLKTEIIRWPDDAPTATEA